MSLFDKIFRPNKAKESEAALKNARTFFQTLTAYKPAFTDWKGEIYEADLVRSAIDSRARHISKLKIDMYGSAQQGLKTKLMLAPSQYSTWSQFLYRVSTILDCTNNCCNYYSRCRLCCNKQIGEYKIYICISNINFV